MDGRVSFIALILSGVPQGTVLGPILLLIFINDITTCVLTSTIRCFANDTRVCKAVSSCQDFADLQKDLENIITWSDYNNMMLHEDKFEYICHQANRSNLLLQLPFTSTYFEYHTLGGITLHPANNIRDLGVYISDDLSWTLHIATMILMILYKSLVRCHLEYCSPLWNTSKIADIQNLESIQRTFTSKIAGLKDLHYWERLKKLSL